jgi:hypothetical protein
MNYQQNMIIEIFSGTLWETGMIQSLLRDAEIESFTRNETGTAYGYNPTYSEDVKVMIKSTDVDLATIIVDDYRSKLKQKTE